MFNLLRKRLRGKKHSNKNKYNIDVQQQKQQQEKEELKQELNQNQNGDNEPKCLVNKHKNESITTKDDDVCESREYYRQFREHDVNIQPTAVVTAANVGSSITDRSTKRSTTRDDEGDEQEQGEEEEEETRMNINLHVDGEKVTLRYKSKAINAGKIYVESSRENQKNEERGENLRQEYISLVDATASTSFSTRTFAINENANDEDQQQQQQEQLKERHREEQQVEYVRSNRDACGFSHNEQAEWQRRVLRIGEFENLPNRKKNHNHSNNNNNNHKINRNNYNNTNTIITENNAKVIKKNNSKINSSTLCKNDVGNQIDSNENATTTNTPSTVNNEVKYRNLDKKKSRNEAKRQSRLSFTFTGISFNNNKKRNEDHLLKNDKLVNDKDKARSGVPATKTETETSSNLHNPVEKSTVRKNYLGPLQKSREFLNDLFMARGRHNNRHRHQQPQQPAKQQGGESRKNATLHGGGSGGGGVPHATDAAAEGAGIKIINRNLIGDGIKNEHNKSEDETRVSGSEGNVSEHLELNCDRASDSTNSYQIPSAKNSAKNFQTNASTTTEREISQQIHSNSARYVGEEHSPETRAEMSGANNDVLLNTTVDVEQPEDNFIRTAHIDRYGGNSANTANENSAEDNNIDGDTHGEPAEAGVIPSSTTTTTTSSYENTNHLIKASSSTINTANESNEISSSGGDNNKIKLNNIGNLSNASTLTNMGQTNTKPSDTSVNICREFRESSVTSSDDHNNNNNSSSNLSNNKLQSVESQPINVELPTIIVADYSGGVSCEKKTSSPVDKEIFYEFDKNDHTPLIGDDQHIKIMEANNDENSDVFYNGGPTTNDQYNNNKWQTPNNSFLSQTQMRHNHVKLEDVREENEDEEEDRDDDNDKEESDEDEEEEEESENSENNMRERRHHLDNELYKSSSERSPLKSSDTTLSGSPSDSGIGTDSQPETPLNLKNRNSPSFKLPATTPSYTHQLKQSIKQQYGYMSFVRDGNSTDCDEGLLPCDDIDVDLADEDGSSERLVCIESISLPDVVVESTTASSSSATLSSASSTNSGEHIININGASGNNMGNVHFIPIHVEGTKKRSVDDSCIGGGTIEITEDASVINGFGDSRTVDKLKRELSDQKSRFNVQLEDAQRNVQNLQDKVNEMQMKIQKLEQELSTKAWNVERLQGELDAAEKDDDYVKKKLKLLEDEKTALRHKFSENEEEFRRRYEELEEGYKELENKYKQTQSLASKLQTQLAMAQSEAEQWREEVDKIRTELEEQMSVLKNALEFSEAERKISADKWQREFEMLRNQHQDREESLMTDCEWQLRQMQKQCKDKIDKTDRSRQDAAEKAELLEAQLSERQREVKHLRLFQAEVKSLRAVVTEQEGSIRSLMTQIDNLKAELQTTNDSLQTQIEAVEKIKFQCNNALCDKERQMIYRIDEVRNEAAAFWEDKLYTEMTRLKNELESVYVEERREALDKLQCEHIEELRAITNRYSLNEEEIRAELAEVQERLEHKNEEFMDMREKSDNALLQTRMHLDRADREYQNAMCREEQRREDLEGKLKKDFEEEKEKMEEKFLERLGQVKEEFSKELQTNTQSIKENYKKIIEQQRIKLTAERDEALHELTERHRQKITDAEEKMKDIETRHQRDLKDLKATYDMEKAALDKRDISNANEIEQLHRRCRCLTNLFEEMRMRYERREPRPEDLKEIAELRSRCESQERDLYLLTDRLREMQIQMSKLSPTQVSGKKNGKTANKPPSKIIPTNCDIIYEENEERESPTPNGIDSSGDDDDDEDDSEERKTEKSTKKVNEINVNKKVNTINEDDAHMITAV